MEFHALLQNIWFILIGVLFAGYAVLDGFDLGSGTLMPFLSKKEDDRRSLLESIWPFWDGNEVWLITAGGALFAAFPHAYATVFSGFYLALMLVLFALIFRAVSMEFWFFDEKRRGIWQKAFFISSFLPSLLYGVALGNVLVGIPLDANMEFTGNFFTLLRPYPLALGLLGLSAILLQGCTYLALKADGEIAERARLITPKIWLLHLITFILSFIAAYVYLPEAFSRPPAWIFFIVALAAAYLSKRSAKKGEAGASFFMSSLSFLGLWGIAGSILYPNVVRATDAAKSITIFNGSSSELTLNVMLVIAAIGVPIVLIYTIYIYRVFKGKITKLHY